MHCSEANRLLCCIRTRRLSFQFHYGMYILWMSGAKSCIDSYYRYIIQQLRYQIKPNEGHEKQSKMENNKIRYKTANCSIECWINYSVGIASFRLLGVLMALWCTYIQIYQVFYVFGNLKFIKIQLWFMAFYMCPSLRVLFILHFSIHLSYRFN